MGKTIVYGADSGDKDKFKLMAKTYKEKVMPSSTWGGTMELENGVKPGTVAKVVVKAGNG